MTGDWEDALAMLFALGFMVIAGAALGQAIDNYAANADPSSPYHAGSDPIPKIIDCDIKPGCVVWGRE